MDPQPEVTYGLTHHCACGTTLCVEVEWDYLTLAGADDLRTRYGAAFISWHRATCSLTKAAAG